MDVCGLFATVKLAMSTQNQETEFTRVEQQTITKPLSPIQNPWFDEIVAGRKTVEGRAAPRSRFEPWIGKTIKIKEEHGKREALVKVTDVRSYPDLEAYLEAEGWEITAPHTGSIEGARKAYADVMMKENIQVFSPERVAQRGGIQAIEMILVDP